MSLSQGWSSIPFVHRPSDRRQQRDSRCHSWDSSKYRVYLEWMEAKSRMVISKGEARISLSQYEPPQVLVLHFPPGSFPPAPSGRLYFPSFSYGITLPYTANFTIELDVRPVCLSDPGIAMSFAGQSILP